jgi:hypothetical protein
MVDRLSELVEEGEDLRCSGVADVFAMLLLNV